MNRRLDFTRPGACYLGENLVKWGIITGMAATLDHEAQWVAQAVSGDFEAFAVLYTRHVDAIYRYIFYRNGDVKDAEDLTEQVFLKAWEAMPHYKTTSSGFIHWLYRIAHNAVVDHHRRRKLITFEGLEENMAFPEHTPETALEQVISKEELARLATSIARLPETYQQVIILRFIEGLDHAEIAQILDKSEGACRGIQHRALASLQKLLSDEAR
jgi:RNA polymerase sigma-70 factor (ECF subfamily)